MARMRFIHGICGVVALALLLAGCGASTIKGGAPTATATTAPTATATPVPTVAASVLDKCFGAGTSKFETGVQVGDIVYIVPQVAGLAYPAVQVPDGTDPAHPLKISEAAPGAYQTSFPTSPLVLTGTHLADRGGGFTLGVCNVSGGKTHTLNSAVAKIASFGAYGGTLNSWQACDGALDSHHNLAGGGCGGAMAGCVCFHAPFLAAATAGTQVDLTQTDASLIDPGDGKGKLPLALAPGKGVTLFVGMDVPSAVGRYAFAFGFRWDGATTPAFAPASTAVLLAPTAHKWTGQACQQPALLAQIAATTPESYYICAS